VNGVEIRPHVPELGDVRIVPDPRPWIARCQLVVDRRAGTATWSDDSRKQRRADLRVGEGPGELYEIVRAVYPPAMPNDQHTTLSGRLLLVDRTGRVLARSLLLPQPLFEQMWPFSLLDSTGLPVREERFGNTRLAQRAHPGAAPLWPVTAGWGWFLLTLLVCLAVLGGLATLVVQLTGWSA
jgi:hypothetical protein